MSTSELERLRALEVKVDKLEEDARTLSRNLWAVVMAVILLVAKAAVDYYTPTPRGVTTQGAFVIAALWNLIAPLV